MTKKFYVDQVGTTDCNDIVVERMARDLSSLAHAQRIARKLREDYRRDPRALDMAYATVRFYAREGMAQ